MTSITETKPSMIPAVPASFENMNRDWADRVKAEMDVAAEFAAQGKNVQQTRG